MSIYFYINTASMNINFDSNSNVDSKMGFYLKINTGININLEN